jgi:uncharacterized membrane protein
VRSIDPWTIVRFLHVLAATVWVGGQLALSGLVLPVLRRAAGVDERSALVTEMGRRFGILTAAGLFPILLATGLAMSYRYGVQLEGFQTYGYGATLAVKVTLVFVVLALAAGHGIAAQRATPGLGRALAMGSLVGSVAIVLLAVSLVP